MTVTSQQYPVTFNPDGAPVSPLALPPPVLGFTNWQYVVVSNYTPYIATLSGVDDDQQNQPSLQPFTANLYPFTNRRGPLSLSFAGGLGGIVSAAPGATITVDYSDNPNPQQDFTGTYPCSLPPGLVPVSVITPPGTVLEVETPDGPISPFILTQMGSALFNGPVTAVDFIDSPDIEHDIALGTVTIGSNATGQGNLELLQGFTGEAIMSVVIPAGNDFYAPIPLLGTRVQGSPIFPAQVTVTWSGTGEVRVTVPWGIMPTTL